MPDPIEAARAHDDAFDAKDVEARRDAQTSDIEVVMPGVELQGNDQAVEVVKVFWEAVPDAKLTRTNEMVVGDVVVVEGAMTGTHTGTLRTPDGDVPASGQPINLRYAALKRIRDGKVASEHLYFDRLEFMHQIGAMPPS